MVIGGISPRLLILILLMSLGAILVVLPDLIPFWHAFLEPAAHLGEAVLVASILAFTIDRWFKADLAKDAFYAAVGHILPDEFRDEIAKLISHGLMCEHHMLALQVEDAGNDATRVTIAIERTLRNITSRAMDVGNSIAVDEWDSQAGKSEIVECKMILDGHEISAKPLPVTGAAPAFSCTTAKRQLEPGATVTFLSKAVEYHRSSDAVSFVFSTPTRRPAITVTAPGFEHDINFGPIEQKVTTETFSTRRTLRGTYFPAQHMRVRWWKKH